ncbi:MAG TPA: hypothetical protein VG056_10080, partial [Pirellulales bacterium]|nr:hypothetical protein [Pirellulales bacterium]
MITRTVAGASNARRRAPASVASDLPMQKTVTTAEHARLAEIRDQVFGWRRWGPYVSERSWATVREDYS